MLKNRLMIKLASPNLKKLKKWFNHQQIAIRDIQVAAMMTPFLMLSKFEPDYKARASIAASILSHRRPK